MTGHSRTGFVWRPVLAVFVLIVLMFGGDIYGSLTADRRIVPDSPFDPRMSRLVKEGWYSHAKLLIEQKKIKEAPPFEEAFDLRFFEDTAKKYAQWLKDLKPLP